MRIISLLFKIIVNLQISASDDESAEEVEVVEERMSEEDLLKAMQDNMVDKKNNRRSF